MHQLVQRRWVSRSCVECPLHHAVSPHGTCPPLLSKRSGSFGTGFDGGIDSTSAAPSTAERRQNRSHLRRCQTKSSAPDGIAVELVGQASEHRVKHAMELLRALMRDERFAGQLATEKPLRKFYTAICRCN